MIQIGSKVKRKGGDAVGRVIGIDNHHDFLYYWVKWEDEPHVKLCYRNGLEILHEISSHVSADTNTGDPSCN